MRRQRRIDPVIWFIRRQLWFFERRPWRARARTLEELVARAVGYAPVEDAVEVCAAALTRLKERGEAGASDTGLRLTARGLAACDGDERTIDANLLARWPAWGEREIHRLRGILARLNGRLLALARVDRGGPGR